MKKPGFNVLLLILALLLVLAMAVTLLYGRRGTSRHGYGRDLTTPPYQETAVTSRQGHSPAASRNAEFFSHDTPAPASSQGITDGLVVYL